MAESDNFQKRPEQASVKQEEELSTASAPAAFQRFTSSQPVAVVGAVLGTEDLSVLSIRPQATPSATVGEAFALSAIARLATEQIKNGLTSRGIAYNRAATLDSAQLAEVNLARLEQGFESVEAESTAEESHRHNVDQYSKGVVYGTAA